MFVKHIVQSPPASSSSPASSAQGAIVSFNAGVVDPSQFSLVVIPTSLHVTNLGQCLLNSAYQ